MSLIKRFRRASSSAWKERERQESQLLRSQIVIPIYLGQLQHNKATFTLYSAHGLMKFDQNPPPVVLLVLIQMSLTIRNWALACCTRLSCSDWLMLVKMPASGLKCSTLPWRFVRKWPKLRMQHTRTTHCGKVSKKQDL